jgi:hypothetical protein
MNMANGTVATPDPALAAGTAVLSESPTVPIPSAPTMNVPLAGANAGAPQVPVSSNPPAGTAPELNAPGTPAPGSFGGKLADALGAMAAHPGLPTAIAKPGGWARAMLAGTMSALSSGVNRVAEHGGIGSYFPGMENARGPLGSLAGALNQQSVAAQAARDKAKKDQQENVKFDLETQREKQQTATSNAQMIHEQALTHQIGDQAIEASIESGKKSVETLKNASAPGDVVAEDKTSDEVQKMIADGTFKPTEQTAYPTGRRQIGENPDGTPKYQTTYTVMGLPKEVTISKDEAADMSKWTGRTITEGQTLSGADYNALKQQAENNRAATAARDKALIDAKLVTAEQTRKMDAVDIGPVFNNAMSDAMRKGASISDAPVSALRTLQARAKADPDFAKRYPNLEQSVKDAYGEKNWDALVEEHQKHVDKMAEEHQKTVDENAAKYGDLGTGGVVMTDALKNQISALTPDKQKLLDVQPKGVQASLLGVAFGPGDVEFDKIFPARLTKGAPGLNAQEAYNVVKQLNPNWDMKQYRAMSTMYRDVTEGKLGVGIGQYNNVLQHAGEAYGVLQETEGRGGVRLANMALNKIEKEFGGTEYSRIQTALLPVKEEISLLLAGGYMPKEAIQAEYDTILNPAATPKQIREALKIIGSVGAIRLENINQQYKRLANQNIPGILTDDSMKAARALDLDPTTMGRLNSLDVNDTLFHDPDWKKKVQNDAETLKAQQEATAKQHQGEVHGGIFHPSQQLPALMNLQSNGTVTIGWDGTQWVDATTRKPYTGAK